MILRMVGILVLVLFFVSNGEALEEKNIAPVADAGQDKTVMSGTRVVLNGSGSSDADGDALSYRWTQTGGDPVELKYANSPTPSFVAPEVQAGHSLFEFTLVVTENRAKDSQSSKPDKVVLTVQPSTAPPNCDLATPSIQTLSPPDHKLRRVYIQNVVDDSNDPYNIVTLDIMRVTQDEPVNGEGDGNTAPDAVIHVADPFDSVSLRAERADKGDGRVYVVSFTATDGFESCKGKVSVFVPQNKGSKVTDSGQKIDATKP